MSVDGKTYYLNHSCVSKFSDKWTGKSESERGERGRVGLVVCFLLFYSLMLTSRAYFLSHAYCAFEVNPYHSIYQIMLKNVLSES